MIFGKRKTAKLTPPGNLGAADIATESSICTGETVVGFKEPKTGRLLAAVAVKTEHDIIDYYAAYGFSYNGR